MAYSEMKQIPPLIPLVCKRATVLLVWGYVTKSGFLCHKEKASPKGQAG